MLVDSVTGVFVCVLVSGSCTILQLEDLVTGVFVCVCVSNYPLMSVTLAYCWLTWSQGCCGCISKWPLL